MDTEDPAIQEALKTLASIPGQARQLTASEVLDQAVRQLNAVQHMGDASDSDEIVIRRPLMGLKKAELTINNGTYDLTFTVRGWWRDRDGKKGSDRKKAHEPPDQFYMDVHAPGERYGKLPVAVIFPDYRGALPTYTFKLSNQQHATKSHAIIYAAHVVFLKLDGVDIEKQKWTDAAGREQPPTTKYEIQHVSACMCCGRKLFKPASIDRGFGPVCAVRIAKGFNYDTRAFRVVGR